MPKGKENTERGGKLRLDILDVYNNRLDERVDISLRNQLLNDVQVIRGISASKRILIVDLFCEPQGVYKVEVDAPSYLPVSFFVSLRSNTISERQVILPINPRKVTRTLFPSYQVLPGEVQRILESSDQVLGFEGTKGEALYGVLDDVSKAGFLNIVSKCGRTRVSNNSVLSNIIKLSQIRADRLFCAVSPGLREDARKGIFEGLFVEVPGALHYAPEGFTLAGSFKTPDNYASLQLTFFAKGEDWSVSVDIDDGRGVEHLFQVPQYSLTELPTHPYLIHDILVQYQALDPGYRLLT